MSKEQKFQLRNKNILEVSEKIIFPLFCQETIINVKLVN